MKNQLDGLSKEEFLDIRLKLRLSQERLARLLGLTRLTINRMENDRAPISIVIAWAVRHLLEHYKPEIKPIRLPKSLRKSWENADVRTAEKSSPTLVASLRGRSTPNPESA
jgi:transcriptional regulator with XRE-family HTH domain